MTLPFLYGIIICINSFVVLIGGLSSRFEQVFSDLRQFSFVLINCILSRFWHSLSALGPNHYTAVHRISYRLDSLLLCRAPSAPQDSE